MFEFCNLLQNQLLPSALYQGEPCAGSRESVGGAGEVVDEDGGSKYEKRRPRDPLLLTPKPHICSNLGGFTRRPLRVVGG